MNTSTSMRTILAAAAAGALVLGSAAGVASAKPSTPKGPKAGYLQVTKVDFHRHSPANVFANATTRDLQLRATVRDTARAEGADPTSVTVTVAQYTKKRGDLVSTGFTTDVTLDLNKPKKNEKTYKGAVPGSEIRAWFTTAPNALPVGATAYVCIKDIVLVGPAGITRPDKKPVLKKENGGDCIKVVNVDPATTDTKTDDPAPTVAPIS
jgi:hypothetical protein